MKPMLLRVQKQAADYLYNQTPARVVIVCLALLGGIAGLDYYTGAEISFSIFYLGPISLGAWFARRRAGVLLSVTGALLWFAADALHGIRYPTIAITGWNALVRLSFFLLTTYLLTEVHRKLKREEQLASIDSLTGAWNGREFYERVEAEIARSQRYQRPFTLAYLDLDNFKQVNDTRGHAEGDLVLKTVAAELMRRTRRTDLVARLGGDEFALLLPETDGEAAQRTMTQLRVRLLESIRSSGWPVTFSIGVVTYRTVFPDVQQAIRHADELMYKVKKDTKNGVLFQEV